MATRHPRRIMRALARAIVPAVAMLTSAHVLLSQQGTPPRTPVPTPASQPAAMAPAKKTPVFPDEFWDLDEGIAGQAQLDNGIAEQLERARQRYLKALLLIEQKDTLAAARQFESAIVALNELASYPKIEDNQDFTDLAQSVIEDYEAYVSSIDDLDENSSAFILREKLFEEVETYSRASKAEPKKTAEQTKAETAALPVTTIPLVMNESVEKSVRFLAENKGRKFMKRWIERSGKWFSMMKRIAKEEEMPEEIIFLSMMESGLDPNAFSLAKAVGLWQFMQATGQEYGLTVNFWIDERRDPEKSTRAAMRFLKDLYRDFGDWHLALAAYNRGAGGVKQSMRKTGSTTASYWETRDYLPRETRNYVPLYIATTLINLQREKYGFTDDSLTFHPEYAYDVFMVKEPTNIAALAKCAGMTVDSIRKLNPELVKPCTPPNVDFYAFKVPKGSLQTFASKFESLTDDEKRPWMAHTVARGETIASIAKRYGVTSSDVASVNQLTGYKSKLKRGMSIRIPMTSVGSQPQLAMSEPASTTPNDVIGGAATPESMSPRRHSQPSPTVAVPTAVTTEVAGTTTMVEGSKGRTTVKHTVQNGENLYSIARRYGVRLTDLRNWNNISYDKENIRIGDTLVVAITDEATRSVAASDVEKIRVSRVISHTVARGETLAGIASLYSTSTDRIRSLNKLPRNGALKSGKPLRVETSLSKTELAAIVRSAPTGKPQIHGVRKGESLSSIAATYGVDEAQLRRWNNDVLDGSTVFAGTKLRIYSAQTTDKGSAAPSPDGKRPPKNYVVRRGDTLSEIADKFGLSVTSLMKKNRNLSERTIRAGQTIRLQ
ncbi:hypothetical protein BH10BAC6_BH10BAC6_02750 [soil metagenome]